MKSSILIVDDEPNMRTILSGLLGREGYEVESASDGAEALARLSETGGRFHVVVTDLRMPGIGGMEQV